MQSCNRRTEFGKDMRIYEYARLTHLERVAAEGFSGIFFYRHKLYDFDEQLARRIGARQVSRARLLWEVLRLRPVVVELPEPGYVAAWPTTVCALVAVFVGKLRFGRRTRVVCYAIENGEIDRWFSDKVPLPKSVAGALFSLIYRFLAARYDRIAFGTAAAKDNHARLVRGSHGGAAFRLFPALAKACPECNLVKEKVVLFLGSFERRKGIPDLLAAWPLVQEADRDHGSYRLKILGKGPLEESIADFAAQQSKCELVLDPSRPVIHSALASAEVLVLLSQPTLFWREQIGLPLLEGLSHGCKIVTTNETGIAAWLKENGHVVVRAGSEPRQVADGILQAMASSLIPQQILATLPAEDTRLAASKWMYARSV